MTTDDAKANAVHFAPERSTDPVACGEKNPATVTFYLEYATCPACLTAMGEPRVVSGTDAGEGTAEPTMYQIACPPGIPLVSPQADRMRAEALEAMKRCSTFAETTVGGQAQCKLPSGHECPHEYNHAVTARRRAERGTVPAPVLLSPCCFCSNEQACIAAGKCSQRETSEARCTVPAPAATKENLVEAAEDPTWSPGPPCRGCGRPLYLCNLRVADGCPCNGPRRLNHGIVPVLTCTCGVCDPAKTGSTRQPFDVPAPAETPPVHAYTGRNKAPCGEPHSYDPSRFTTRWADVTCPGCMAELDALAPAETPPKASPSGKPVWFPEPPAETPAPPGHAAERRRTMTREEHKALSDKFNAGHATLREALTLALAELDEGAPAAPVTHEGNSVIRARAIVSVALRMVAAVPAAPAFLGAAPSQAAAGLIRACGDLANANDYVAPAPGAGEGARELPFAEAMALDPSEVEWTCDTLESHAWSPFELFQHLSLAYLRRCRFRRKPAPAPKPGRVAEIRARWEQEDFDTPTRADVDRLCEYVVDAHQEEIRRRLIGGWQSSKATADIDKLLADARVAMLGAEAGK